MTTDEATKSEGEVQAAALAEHGEDITPARDRGVLKVELLDFKGEDLFEDGGIIRRIKRKGEGYSNPNEGATVEIHLEGFCGGTRFDCKDVKFIVGEGEDHDIPIGIDKALEKMQRGEHCILYLAPRYGFGEAGKPKYGIQANMELVYEVTLKSFEKAKESWEMDTKEKLEQAAVVKEKGTMYFKDVREQTERFSAGSSSLFFFAPSQEGKYLQAVIQYGKIVSWLEMEYGLSEKESKASDSFLLAAFLNLAMCYLKLREYTKAVECCDKALGLDQDNEKGLYRRGEARLLMNEFELAKCDFQKVLEVNPQNKAAKSQISVCQKKTKEHNERDRRIYANMFTKFAERDAKEAASKTRVEKVAERAACEKGSKTDAEDAEGHV
ncbi:peptidyl-prolyl cis-trans isomerase FKBP5 isoform X3 [Lathamus discolor]|uniref:peptidyl-prolyl cis-trans isomerase FKBP5 isoform X3 n=1 Tax=Lathamus discolor TaxID=678569 RepID=UPI0032B7765E